MAQPPADAGVGDPCLLQESAFLSPLGAFRVTSAAPAALTESLLFKLSYLDFASKHTSVGAGVGMWGRGPAAGKAAGTYLC